MALGRPRRAGAVGTARALRDNMTHLEHPTQAAACGRNVPAVSAEKFRAAQDQCKACARTLAAADAGRPHFSGYDDGAGDTGAR